MVAFYTQIFQHFLEPAHIGFIRCRVRAAIDRVNGNQVDMGPHATDQIGQFFAIWGESLTPLTMEYSKLMRRPVVFW